jgi:hypothetical protein
MAEIRSGMLRGPADQEDRQFDAWFRGLPWFREFVQQHGEAPNPNDPDYDYRAAHRAGVKPERYAPDQNRYHWPSLTPQGAPLKSETHPTMWAEKFMQATGTDPFTIGIRDADAAKRYLNR